MTIVLDLTFEAGVGRIVVVVVLTLPKISVEKEVTVIYVVIVVTSVTVSPGKKSPAMGAIHCAARRQRSLRHCFAWG